VHIVGVDSRLILYVHC